MLDIRIFTLITTFGLCFLTGSGCKRNKQFDSIGLSIAGPIDAGVREANGTTHFYVLNADLDNTYASGSILVLDSEGNKVNSVEVPRLGRHLDIAGDDLIVGFNPTDEESQSQVMLFDIAGSNAESPVLMGTWTLDCMPLKAAMRPGYRHFVVTCAGGKIYLGDLKTPRSESTLVAVRDYGKWTRRAVYLDSERELFMAFVTDIGEQGLQKDYIPELVDARTYIGTPDDVDFLEEPNEHPDLFEDTPNDLKRRARYHALQFAVYDISAERDKGFPYEEVSDDGVNEINEDVEKELRFLYWTLYNSDQTPDTRAQSIDPDLKWYPLNFRKAMADPYDPDVFYISQRDPGEDYYLFSTNIVKARFIGDPRIQNGEVPALTDYLEFERIYGFRGEVNEFEALHFPGDFEIQNINGQDTLLVNHFRDRSVFQEDEYYYAITGKTLDQSWINELGTRDPGASFYQLAVNSSGRALSCLFYGNALILLDVLPGTGITEVKRIY